MIESRRRLPFVGCLPTKWQHRYWKLAPVHWEHDFYVVTTKHLKESAGRAGFTLHHVRNFNSPADAIPHNAREGRTTVETTDASSAVVLAICTTASGRNSPTSAQSISSASHAPPVQSVTAGPCGRVVRVSCLDKRVRKDRRAIATCLNSHVSAGVDLLGGGSGVPRRAGIPCSGGG